MLRNACVICESKLLKEVYTLKNYPITPSSNQLDYSTDEFQDCIFVSCTNCGCVQLKTLIDPVKLYLNSHNSTDFSETWKQHHNLFAEFVIDNSVSSKSVIEVGGNSGTLYRILSKYIADYTILDISDTEKRPAEVKFIQGNCESFDFSGYSSVILSHTFEHLYNPRLFVKNLCDANVKSVFISIPNMEHLSSSENMSVLHNEHTYFVGDYEIKYVFSHFNYTCISSYEFKAHSRFYHFVFDYSSLPRHLNTSLLYTNQILNIFQKYQILTGDLDINAPCFICPAGHYGQKIYYYLNRFHGFIKGFLDNDPLKQNKRMYGTPLNVYSPTHLETYKNTKIYIVLYAGPYTNEIKGQLNGFHSDIEFISL